MKRVVLIGALIIEIALALILFPRTDRASLKSTDFVNFYGAGSLVRQGKGALLYRRETQDPVLQSILGHKSNQYFLHPPFEAAALVPFSYLKIEQAFVVWSLVNAGLLAPSAPTNLRINRSVARALFPGGREGMLQRRNLSDVLD